MQQRRVMMRVLTAGAVMLLTAGAASAQSVFRAAPTYQLSGMTGDATSLFALIDVGSQDGPLDGILDVVAAEQNQSVTLLLGNGTNGKGDGTFSAGVNTQVGRIPSAMAVADFNGDHIPDLLIGDLSNTVAFFVGTGSADAPFTAQGDPIPAGVGPVAIVAADVDGDGNMDAIVVDEGTDIGGVTILIGHGNGTFTQPSDVFPAGAGTFAAVAFSSTPGSKPDLAVVNRIANTVTIMRNAGTGFFTTTQTILVGEEPIAIAAHDFNNDGFMDLVVTNKSSDNIAVIDGVSAGAFGTTARFFVSDTAGGTPTGLTLADVNHDGFFDVLIPNNRSSDASVLLGEPHSNFAAPRIFVADTGPLGIGAGDVNGDNVPDVVCVNGLGNQFPDVAVLLSRGDGSLDGIEDLPTQPYPTAVIAGDVDNDGVADLLATHSNGIVLVYQAQPPLGFAEPFSLQAAGDAAAIGRGDFNADGRLDIAVVNKSTSNVTVFLGLAGGGFGAGQNYPIGSGAAAVAVGDWNHDGRADLAVAEQGTGPTGVVEILLATTDGKFPTRTPFPAGMSPIAIDFGDFNDDRLLDLAVANSTSGDVTILKGNGDGTFTALSPIASLHGPKALVVSDFDHDGHDDIAVALTLRTGSANGGVNLFFGDGHGAFTAGPQSLSVDNTPSALAARDFNGDGIADLLVADDVANAITMFRSLGANRRFAQDDRPAPAVGRRPISLAAADFNGDGRYDGASADNFAAGSASVLTNIECSSESSLQCTTPLPVLRGDGNGDKVVSVADAVAVMREVADGNGRRIEDVKRGGTFAASPGVDANGDGLVTTQDALAVAHRLFPGS